MITVNGVKRTLEQPLSVTEYLEKNQYIPVQVAIELNDQILARELYGSTILKEGDVMEIVSFMGGGSGKNEEMDRTEDKLILPEACPDSDPSWFGFLMTCREGVDRNQVVPYIEGKGVQTRMLFAGNLVKHPCFDQMREAQKGYRIPGTLEHTDRIMRDSFWIGVYPGMTENMLDYMIQVVREAVNLH